MSLRGVMHIVCVVALICQFTTGISISAGKPTLLAAEVTPVQYTHAFRLVRHPGVDQVDRKIAIMACGTNPGDYRVHGGGMTVRPLLHCTEGVNIPKIQNKYG